MVLSTQLCTGKPIFERALRHQVKALCPSTVQTVAEYWHPGRRDWGYWKVPSVHRHSHDKRTQTQSQDCQFLIRPDAKYKLLLFTIQGQASRLSQRE